jgi:hypothetical protein
VRASVTPSTRDADIPVARQPSAARIVNTATPTAHRAASGIWAAPFLRDHPHLDGGRRVVRKGWSSGWLWLGASAAAPAGDLTSTEMRWLQGAAPVVAYAKENRIPLDIVVQPQDAPGAAPLALGFVDGRCKLVLSMRGNPEAQATLERIDADLLDATLELMAAHELGHCQRYLEGTWRGLPAGFTAREPAALDGDDRKAYVTMRSVRREEGYADLVGLAWAQQRHAPRYARLHNWLRAERSKDLTPGTHHDTLAWIELARDPRVFTTASVFQAAAALWPQALTRADP